MRDKNIIWLYVFLAATIADLTFLIEGNSSLRFYSKPLILLGLILYFYRRHLVGRGEKSVIDMLAQQHQDQHVGLLWFLDYEPIKQGVKVTLKEVEKLTKLK